MRRIRWVLLDRDGTVNVPAPHPEYITTREQLRLLPRAAEAIGRLNQAGMPVAIVTNQRGVALGLMSAQDLEEVNAALEDQLAVLGARVDMILSCPHHRDVCDCRKPQPGLLNQAAAELGLPLGEAAMVGDAESDVEAGRRAGTLTIRLGGESLATKADLVAPTLWDAVDLILGCP